MEWDYDRIVLTADVWQHFSFNTEQLVLLREVPSQSDTVLDLCTGFGNLVSILCQYSDLSASFDSPLLITGVDISSDALRYVREQTNDHPSMTLVEGDVRSLPYEGDFDAVTCASSLFVDPVEAVVAGAYRALKPGGKFVFTGVEPEYKQQFLEQNKLDLIEADLGGNLHFEDDKWKAYLKKNPISNLGLDKTGINFGRLIDILPILEEAGFEVLETKPFANGTSFYVCAQKD